MELAPLVKLAVAASLLLLVFGLGLRATFADATFLFRTSFEPPHRLLRAIGAMYVIVPLIAATLATLFDLRPPVKIALLAMAVSPVPPILPGKQLRFAGDARFVYGLLVAVSLAAIVVVPVLVRVVGWLFGRELHIGVAVIARSVALSILVPLLLGLIVRQLAPRVAERIAPWASRLGSVLLVVGLVPILIASWPAFVALVGSGTLLAFAAAALAAIVAGHWLGGPDPHERPVLALASAMRHPGIAIAIAHENFPDDALAPAAILLFLVVGVVATSIYGAVATRRLRDKPA